MQMLEVVDDNNMMFRSFRTFRILKLLTNFLLDIFGNAISSHIYVYRLYVLLVASFFASYWQNNCPIHNFIPSDCDNIILRESHQEG